MASLNLLTGKEDTRGARKPAAASPPANQDDQNTEPMKAALEALTDQIKRQAAELEASRNETTAERLARTNLQERLSREVELRLTTEGQLAAEQATSAGLRAQLETEREAREALKALLEQAIAAAAKPPVIVPAAVSGEQPSYEVSVTNRDINDRMRTITIKPMKAKE